MRNAGHRMFPLPSDLSTCSVLIITELAGSGCGAKLSHQHFARVGIRTPPGHLIDSLAHLTLFDKVWETAGAEN